MRTGTSKRTATGKFSFKCLTCEKVVEKEFFDKTRKYMFCGNECRQKYMRGPNKVSQYKGQQKRGEYVAVVQFGHPNADSDNLVPQHELVAEQALGHYLPKTAVVHHVNGIKIDNRSGNLVICENERYHQLLHVRINRKKKYGNPNLKKCERCKEVKFVEEFGDNERSVDGKNEYCQVCFKPKDKRRSTYQTLKTHCNSGHLLEGDNLIIRTNGNRACKTCRREAGRIYMQEKRRELST